MAASVLLFDDVMDTFHQLGVDEEVADKIVQHPAVLQTTLEEISGGTSPARPQQCVHDNQTC